MIKAVFIDIDGTLANSQRQISKRNEEAIRYCTEKGIKVILASGRSRKEASEYQKQLKVSPYIISSNGASVYDLEKEIEIYNEIIDSKIIKRLFKYSIMNDYKIRLNYKEKLVMNKATYLDEKDKVKTVEELQKIIESEKIVQCSISSEDFEKMKKIKEYIIKILQIKIENESKRLNNPKLKPSKSYYCDITSNLVSKGKAVKQLCDYLGIKEDEIIVIGDGENDISMFNITPNSVAMGNALSNVKESAKYVTSTNDEDGVAKVLEKL